MNDLKLPFLNNGIAQVGMVVEDVDKSVETYWKMFGIGPWDIYTYEKPLVKKMSYYGKPTDYRIRIALSYFGPSRIELIQLLDGSTVYEDFIKTRGYGIQHVGVLVDDMEAALDLAKRAGIEMIMDGSGFGLDGDGHYAYLDTEAYIDVMLELIQRPKRRVPPEKIYPGN